MGKTIEQATKHIWRGQWLDNFYALEKCPFCGDAWTLRFYGKHSYVWECKSCGRSGGIGEMLGMLKEQGKMRPELERLFDDVNAPDVPEGLIVLSTHRPRTNVKVLATGLSCNRPDNRWIKEGALTIPFRRTTTW